MGHHDVEEVDEATVQLGKLAHRLAVGKNRQKFLKLVQEEDPNTPIPEVQAQQMVSEATAPLLAEIEKLKEKDAKNEAVNAVLAKRNALKAKFKIDDETVDKVEKFMVENQIANHEKALQFMQDAEKLAAPSPASGRSYTPVTLPTVDKEFMDNPIMGARKEAAKFLDERKGR